MAKTPAVLPKYVVLSTCHDDQNTMFFRRECVDNDMYVTMSANKAGDVWEVMPCPEKGVVRLKLVGDSGSVWKKAAGTVNWVMSNGDEKSSSDANSRFMVKLEHPQSGPAVTIQCQGNNLFVGLASIGSYTGATAKDAQDWGKFRVRDPVTARSMCSFVYNMVGIRPPYKEEKKVVLDEGVATNKGTTRTTLAVQLSYIDKKTRSWKVCASPPVLPVVFKPGNATTSIDVGNAVPTAFPDGLEMQPYGNGCGCSSTKVVSGQMYEETAKVAVTYNVSVPPSKTVRVKLQAKLADFNVPFSYTLSNTFTNGSCSSETMSDGVFHASNYCAFHYLLSFT